MDEKNTTSQIVKEIQVKIIMKYHQLLHLWWKPSTLSEARPTSITPGQANSLQTKLLSHQRVDQHSETQTSGKLPKTLKTGRSLLPCQKPGQNPEPQWNLGQIRGQAHHQNSNSQLGSKILLYQKPINLSGIAPNSGGDPLPNYRPLQPEDQKRNWNKWRKHPANKDKPGNWHLEL